MSADRGSTLRVDPATAALGIDVGSTNTKAALVGADASGGIHELAVRSVPTADDVEQLLAGLERAVSAAIAHAGLVPRVVGIAAMAESGAPVDPAGRAVMPLQHWSGGAQRDVARILGPADPAALFAATGAPLTAKATLVTLARLRTERPGLLEAPVRWAGAAELVTLALTGVLATDHTLALRTLGYRLPPAGAPLATCFDPELLALAGTAPATMPAVLGPGEPVGEVGREVAARTGLTRGTPVFVAGHDHLVGAWAAGVRDAGETADSVGTTEALIRIADRPVDLGAVHGTGSSVVRTVEGRHEALLSGSTGGGALVRSWLAVVAPGDPAPLFAALSAAPPDLGDLVLLPYPGGRQAPEPDPRAPLRLVDRAGRDVDPATRSGPELARALVAGLALQARWMLDAQQALLGTGVGRLVVLGGPVAGNAAWLAAKAAVTPVPLAVASSAEPVAAGAALLAAVRAGLLGEDTALPRRAVDPVAAPADLDERLADFTAAARAAVPEGAP